MLVIILIIIYYFNIKEVISLFFKKDYNSFVAVLVLTLISFYLSFGQVLDWPIPQISELMRQPLSFTAGL
ncbi:hypothetical protein Acear_2005 [Acetohalobium arabaticum DSM 5501]|uniref:Uncharacterized protein n=1 Tax=Acetohalobium arabaticum (strain ATCC 49924 / DSM 5501 / Z-7288) TaxID=574087 RepID=D9QSN9_ACEAZ|nr:hypothetical protein Acear_2005 [Acetohalobium arabaticum DSM 5501]